MINRTKHSFEPRHFQQVAETCFQKGKNIILQAPTGSGKTRAAIRPILKGFEGNASAYPQRMVYGVPMRVLANSFNQQFKKIANENLKWRDNNWLPSIQTGERPEDSLFEGQLIFATVDQMLASFLNVPYSIPKRLDNINAGAFIGSYLVFDEFHLYPSKQMMLTVLAMLKMLKGISRFTLMSATFSPALVQKIGEQLGAKVIAENPETPLSKGIFKDIKHLQSQKRRWSVREGNLSALRIMEQLQIRRKVLVICNTVDRAQEIYREFMCMKNDDTDCVLLHSRFYQEHRSQHEKTALDYLCKDDDNNCIDDGRRKVVIATQVVEVGLDISAEVLLTECAPAASLIQRAGRCVRDGGEGEVHVFQPPSDDSVDGNEPNYAPYVDDGLLDVSLATWAALSSTKFDGEILQYDMEQQLVKEAHEKHDQEHIIDGLEHKINTRIEEIIACISTRHEGYIPKLIRENTGVPLHITRDYKSEAITEKYHTLEGFNVSRGRIFHAMNQMQVRNVDAEWYFASGREDVTDDDEDLRSKIVYQWHLLKEANEVFDNWRFLVNPDAVGYTQDLGLIWQPLAQPATKAHEKHKPGYVSDGYDADTYRQHLEGLLDAYTKPYFLKDGDKEIFYRPLESEYQYALLRLLKTMGREDDWETIDGYIRVTLALHDVGKLNQRWQNWAIARHRLYVEMFGAIDDVPSDGTPLAHTIKGWQKFSTKVDEEKYDTAFKLLKIPARGNHSVESAEAVQAIIHLATGNDKLWNAIITAAICHHHSPDASTINKDYNLVGNGQDTISEVLHDYGFHDEAETWASIVKPSFRRHGRGIKEAIKFVTPNRNRYYPAFLYAIFVRILRLADQRSSDYNHKRTQNGQ